MRKIRKCIGSGMTERALVEFDWSGAEDAHWLIGAAIETFERSSFDRLSRKLERLARQILEEADLPCNPDKTYLIFADGGWAEVEADIEFGLEAEPVSFAEAYGIYELVPDSPEGYAVRVLLLLQTARQQQKAGSIDEAMALAFGAGELANEAGMKDLFEADFIVGAKQRAIGRDALERQHGTPEERAARREAYLQEYDRLRAAGTKKMLAYDLTAERFGVNEKTVRRAVSSRRSN